MTSKIKEYEEFERNFEAMKSIDKTLRRYDEVKKRWPILADQEAYTDWMIEEDRRKTSYTGPAPKLDVAKLLQEFKRLNINFAVDRDAMVTAVNAWSDDLLPLGRSSDNNTFRINLSTNLLIVPAQEGPNLLSQRFLGVRSPDDSKMVPDDNKMVPDDNKMVTDDSKKFSGGNKLCTCCQLGQIEENLDENGTIWICSGHVAVVGFDGSGKPMGLYTLFDSYPEDPLSDRPPRSFEYRDHWGMDLAGDVYSCAKLVDVVEFENLAKQGDDFVFTVTEKQEGKVRLCRTEQKGNIIEFFNPLPPIALPRPQLSLNLPPPGSPSKKRQERDDDDYVDSSEPPTKMDSPTKEIRMGFGGMTVGGSGSQSRSELLNPVTLSPSSFDRTTMESGTASWLRTEDTIPVSSSSSSTPKSKPRAPPRMFMPIPSGEMDIDSILQKETKDQSAEQEGELSLGQAEDRDAGADAGQQSTK